MLKTEKHMSKYLLHTGNCHMKHALSALSLEELCIKVNKNSLSMKSKQTSNKSSPTVTLHNLTVYFMMLNLNNTQNLSGKTPLPVGSGIQIIFVI